MHFFGCFSFFLFSALVPILIALLVEEGWIRGLLIMSTWPIAWTFSKTTNNQILYKIKTYRDKTDVYSKTHTETEQTFILNSESLSGHHHEG